MCSEAGRQLIFLTKLGAEFCNHALPLDHVIKIFASADYNYRTLWYTYESDTVDTASIRAFVSPEVLIDGLLFLSK